MAQDPTNGWAETYRGSVPPWECDITEHFTIAYYFDRLAEAEGNLAEELGLGDRLRIGDFPRRFDVRFARELRAGAGFHIDGAAIGLDGALRLGHRVVNSANGETVTWVAESWDLSTDPLLAADRATIEARLADWDGPAVEERAEPNGDVGFIATARGRARPGDLDAFGRFGLAAFVHRFTDACLQASAAMGMDAQYMVAQRRAYSTFELQLTIAEAPGVDEPLLIESAITNLGNSSLRFLHRMRDPRSGREFARLGQYGVQLDLDARRPARWPDELRARAAAMVAPAA